MTIIVNGEVKTDIGPFISFEEIVSLSDVPHADTVTWRISQKAGWSCVVARGESVIVTAGMIFNAANTGAA